MYNPFREYSEKMIHDTGYVEHFELCETVSRVHCGYCLSHRAKESADCACGICLTHTETMHQLNRKRFDALSMSNYVIKTGCSHGARHGKSEEQIYYHQSFNAWKRCRKRKDAACQKFTGILDRFLKDPQYRETQEKWDGTRPSVRKWTK